MDTTLVARELSSDKSKERMQFAGGILFDWAMVATSSWVLIGGYLDAWAHNHIRLETFFTPWHAVLYSGFLIVASFIVGTLIFNRIRGYTWTHALPPGYNLSLIGVIFFALGGVGDMLWHILFGIELSISAALSPTHILLAICFALIMSGPFRSAWQRSNTQSKPNWKSLAPMIVSLLLTLSVFTLITQFAHPFVRPLSTPSTEQTFNDQALGVVSIILQASILMGLLLLTLRRWMLPFGSLTFIFTLNAVLMSFMQDHYVLIPFIAIAGLIADLLLVQLKPSVTRPDALRVFAFTVPIVLYLSYFLALQLTVGISWTIHLWLGSTVGAGIFGLLLSYLLVPPQIPQEPMSQ